MLNEEQTKLLEEIMNDKYSRGSFSGMVFNAVISTKSTKDDIVDILALALEVRLQLEKLGGRK